jgi:hypothetical protein
VEITNHTEQMVNPNYQPLKTIMAGVNYMKIPDNIDYSKDNYTIEVTGYNNTNQISSFEEAIVNPLPPEAGPSEFNHECSWICDGLTYAYEIKAYSNTLDPHPWYTNSHSFLTLESARQDFGTLGGVPYYEYMSETQFLAQCNSYQTGGPGSCIIDNINNIKITNPQIDYRNAQNNVIPGPVYGVGKDLGPWEGNFISTGSIPTGNAICGNNLGWAINRINTMSGPFNQPNLLDLYGMPDLECTPGFAPSGNSIGTLDQSTLDCIGQLNWVFGDPLANPNANGDVFDYLNAIQECLGNTGFSQWYEDIEEVSIYQILGGNTTQPIDIYASALFNENGEFDSPQISLLPGLYSIALKSTDNGLYLPLIEEIKEPLNSSIPMSSLFSATLYPNPIIENFVDIDMTSQAKMAVDFLITDLNGSEYTKRKLFLEKDQNQNVRISIDQIESLPTGTLICTFIFQDGSSQSYNIINI